MSIKTGVPEGALAAKQRVSDGPEALRIGPSSHAAKHMCDHPGMVMVKSDSIADILAATVGDSHCRAPYPAPKPPVSGS